MLYMPMPSTFHCPACLVEWKAVVVQPCWLCGSEGVLGTYVDVKTSVTYPFTSGVIVPLDFDEE